MSGIPESLPERQTQLLERLRAYCLSLPEASEVEAWGHPTFRAGRRMFACYDYHDGRPCVTFALGQPEAEVLLRDQRFFRPPYSGHRGWVGLWVDSPVSRALIEELALRSYRQVALKRMLRKLDGD